MESSCNVIVALFFLAFSPGSCSDLDQETTTVLAASKKTLSEQSSALAQQSEALSQHSQALARILEQNQLESQGISQALLQMAQGIQEAIIQLTHELSRQHSSFLTHVTQRQCTQQAASLSQMTEEMAGVFRTSQSQLSETIHESLLKMAQDMQESKASLIRQLSESLQEVANEVPNGFEKVSDGWFRIFQVRKSWDDARLRCQDRGGDLATPPTNFFALKRFLYDTIGEKPVLLGGRLVSANEWKYLDGEQVESSHWHPNEPSSNDDCMVMIGSLNPPLVGRHCTDAYFFLCRYGSP